MPFVGMVFTFILGILIILGIIAITIIRMLMGRERKGGPADPNETRLIQELHHGLSKMEKRIESLETILLDPERKDR